MNKKLKDLALIFFLLGLWTIILASLPRAAAQRNDAAAESAKPNVEALQEREAADVVKAEIVKPIKPTNKTMISCYTGVESGGANGRNAWSVATYRYPQGTKLHIEGFGEKVVETVTAKKYSHRIDVWFGETQADYERCLQFGTQLRTVSVIK